MSGKYRKTPVGRSPSSTGGSIKKSQTPALKITRRPPVPTRIPKKISKPATNLNRVQNRLVKREAVQKTINKTQPRPRPVVRPASRPTKNMTKIPAPPPAVLKRSLKPTSPNSRINVSAPPKNLRRGAVGVAAAGAAVAAGTLLALNIGSAHPDISMDANSLQSTLTDLQNRSDFEAISTELANLDATIKNVLNLLEGARERGYVYQSDMEKIAYGAVDRWQSVRGPVEEAVVQQSQIAQRNLKALDPHIRRLNNNLKNPTAGASAIKTAQDQVNQVLWDIEKAENTIENNYDAIESDILQLNSRLTTIHWALDQLKDASFSFDSGEDLVMAVANRLDKEGKDDPEGVLYLSNKRLVFERKEKIATKKVLFVTTSSELVQEVVFSQPLDTIAKIKAQSKGLFGHQDFIELEFSGSNLGTLLLHINGQDSEDWVTLIQRAKSGEIEDERTSGSGISFTDLTGPLTTGDLLAIQNEVNELQDEMMLKSVRDDLSEIETEVSTLERDLADLRARGYAVEKSLEADIQVLTAQWDQVKNRAESTIENQTKILSEQMIGIQNDLAKLMGMSANLKAARPHFVRLKSSIASAEAQADAAEDTVLDLYDEYADEVDGLSTHFDWVDWMLDALSTASFRLLATESGVAATEAVWLRPGLEPENGILYLTDQRLLWEDRVEEYELKIDVPVQQVADVQEISDENADFDLIAVKFDAADAPVAAAQFQLALPVAEEWLQMIGRAKSGDYVSDRPVELDEAEIERVRNAPDQCPNCGAAITSPVLRGQNDITCEYCGVVTRI